MGIKSRLITACAPAGEKEVARLVRKMIIKDGGPGSGNFGHAGRPGEVGGSAPDGEGGPVSANSPKTPKTSEENDDFIRNLPEKDEEHMRNVLENSHMIFIGEIRTNSAEESLIEKSRGQEKFHGIPELAKYLEEKEKLLGVNLFKAAREEIRDGGLYDDVMFGAFDSGTAVAQNFSEALLKMEEIEKKSNPGKDISLEKDGQKIERRFLKDDRVPDELKQDYLELKAAILGYPMDKKEAQTLSGDVLQGVRKFAEKAEMTKNASKFQSEKQNRMDAYDKAETSAEVIDILNKGGAFMPRPYSIVDVEKTSLENAKTVAMAYETVFERFPFLVGTLSGIDEDEYDREAYASCNMAWNGRVSLNASRAFFGGTKEGLEMHHRIDVSRGFHPAGTDSTSIIVHELGHALDGYLTDRGVLGSVGGSPSNNFSGKLKNMVMKSLKLRKEDIKDELSEYAVRDANEWFAECISEALVSKTPRRMATECMRQLDNVLKKEGLNLEW